MGAQHILRAPNLFHAPSSGFNFDSIANLELWLDPARGLSGGNLLDRSGNGRDAAVSGASIVSSWLRFNGSSDYALVDETGSWITGTTMSVYVVQNRRGAVASAGVISMFANGAANDFGATTGVLIGYEGGSNNQHSIYRAGEKAIISSHPGNDVPFVLVARFDGTDCYLDRITSGGTVSATPFATTNAFDIEDVIFGARWNGSPANFTQADYGAILAYSDFKSGTDDTAIRSALVSEWGI
jgi:hypothetical protein